MIWLNIAAFLYALYFIGFAVAVVTDEIEDRRAAKERHRKFQERERFSERRDRDQEGSR